MTKSLHRDYEYKLASNHNVNIKQFWKYVNSRLITCPSIFALKQPDNSVTHSDQEKSELFHHPISLTYSVIKIMGSIIRDSILDHVTV